MDWVIFYGLFGYSYGYLRNGHWYTGYIISIDINGN